MNNLNMNPIIVTSTCALWDFGHIAKGQTLLQSKLEELNDAVFPLNRWKFVASAALRQHLISATWGIFSFPAMIFIFPQRSIRFDVCLFAVDASLH